MTPLSALRRLPAALLCAALAGLARTPREPGPAPVLNWRVPSFTADGYREWTVSGSEAVPLGRERAAVREINVTIYSGDSTNRVETVILSSDALVQLDRKLVTGDGTVRVIDSEFEASGTGWSYDHATKRISLAKNARVTFRAEFKDLLK